MEHAVFWVSWRRKMWDNCPGFHSARPYGRDCYFGGPFPRVSPWAILVRSLRELFRVSEKESVGSGIPFPKCEGPGHPRVEASRLRSGPPGHPPIQLLQTVPRNYDPR